VTAVADAKVWLITGGSTGLGKAIAEAARAAGDIVVTTSRREGVDITDTTSLPGLVAGVVERHGRIDVLVNNAGRSLVGAVEETTDEELRDLMDLHFFAPAALVRTVLPIMREQGTGAIVQISSMGGQLSFAGVSAYSASKFALEGLSEALAQEVRPFGIQVLIVEPGAFRTELHRSDTMSLSARMPEYDEVVGPVRAAQAGFDGTQPGDPAKAAQAIMAALAAERPPLRLVLGNDAADAILGHLGDVRAELLAWQEVSRGTDFGE
jgi:NAD(P)-dependent dehydrogenase (short-subunit alcohol dehydrogenase family)